MFTMLPPPRARISGNYSLHRNNRPQHVEMEDFVEERRIDLFDGCRIASPCVVDDAVDAPEMPVHGGDGFPHAIELRHVGRHSQAARKLVRQFGQRTGVTREQGDFRAAVGQSGRCRKADP